MQKTPPHQQKGSWSCGRDRSSTLSPFRGATSHWARGGLVPPALQGGPLPAVPTACCFLAIAVPAHLTLRSSPHSCVMPQERASLQLPVLNKISHGPQFLGEVLFQFNHRSNLRSRSRHLELKSVEGVLATSVSQSDSRRRNAPGLPTVYIASHHAFCASSLDGSQQAEPQQIPPEKHPVIPRP